MRVLASGTAEKWIKEGKAAHPPGPASPATACGPVRCACSWGHRVQPRTFLRRLTLPLAIQSWSLTSLQQRLFKTGGRLIRHARYFVLRLTERYLTRALFGQILGRIE